MNNVKKWAVRSFLIFIPLIILVGILKPDILGYVAGSIVLVYLIFYMVLAVVRVYKFTHGISVDDDEVHVRKDYKRKTIAKMTGRTNALHKSTRRVGEVYYTEYEITYRVDGREYTKWFNLYPGVDVGDVFEPGTEVSIYYDVRKPQIFEVIKILDEEYLK